MTNEPKWMKEFEEMDFSEFKNEKDIVKYTMLHTDKIKSFISKKLDEQRGEIRNWAKDRCEANMRVMGTDKWNSDLEDLIEKLK